MTSERKHSANRRNAKSSTGPRSATGKFRSRSNALRHGLATSIKHIPGQTEAIELLAGVIANLDENPALLSFARIAAEAEFELIRVRAARAALVTRTTTDPAANAPAGVVPVKIVDALREVVTNPSEILNDVRPTLAETLRRTDEWNKHRVSRPLPNEADRTAIAFGSISAQLTRYDRYERRALSRRKRALRDLDALRIEIL